MGNTTSQSSPEILVKKVLTTAKTEVNETHLKQLSHRLHSPEIWDAIDEEIGKNHPIIIWKCYYTLQYILEYSQESNILAEVKKYLEKLGNISGDETHRELFEKYRNYLMAKTNFLVKKGTKELTTPVDCQTDSNTFAEHFNIADKIFDFQTEIQKFRIEQKLKPKTDMADCYMKPYAKSFEEIVAIMDFCMKSHFESKLKADSVKHEEKITEVNVPFSTIFNLKIDEPLSVTITMDRCKKSQFESKLKADSVKHEEKIMEIHEKVVKITEEKDLGDFIFEKLPETLQKRLKNAAYVVDKNFKNKLIERQEKIKDQSTKWEVYHTLHNITLMTADRKSTNFPTKSVANDDGCIFETLFESYGDFLNTKQKLLRVFPEIPGSYNITVKQFDEINPDAFKELLEVSKKAEKLKEQIKSAQDKLEKNVKITKIAEETLKFCDDEIEAIGNLRNRLLEGSKSKEKFASDYQTSPKKWKKIIEDRKIGKPIINLIKVN